MLRSAVSGASLFKRLVLSNRLTSARMSSGERPKVTDISGIYPPITTPFGADGEIAYDKLEHNIAMFNKLPLRGLAVLGSTGEVVYLKPEEKMEMIRRAREALDPQKLVIGGAGCESTRDTIQMCREMAAAGADAVMVVTPFYYKGRMTNDAMEKHFKQVADASPVPVILYSVPGNTGIDLAPEVVYKLAPHPNIIGMKDSGGDLIKIAHMVYKTQGEKFQILAGSASFLLPALLAGCAGGVCASANAIGQPLCDLYDLFQQGNFAEATELQRRVIGPNTAVTKLFGVPGLKVSMEWFGLYGGEPRPPLLPLNAEEKAKLRAEFVDNGFIK